MTRRPALPAPIADPTRRVYEEAAAICLRRWDRRSYRRPPLLQALLRELPRRARILDLGCGPGQDARRLRAGGHRVVGLDFSRSFLAHARRKSRGLPLVQADLRRLPFHAPAFDAVWAAASLVHLPKAAMRPCLRSLHELVGPGGWLAATLAQGRRTGPLTGGWLPGRFFARWRKPELAAALAAAGWQVAAVQVVTNRERKGRWLVLLARRPAAPGRVQPERSARRRAKGGVSSRRGAREPSR